MNNSFRFLLAVLAVWRVTHLLSREDGPFNVLGQFRRVLGTRMLKDLVSCFYCLSIWVAAPFAWFLQGTWVERTIGWLALSGAAILLERTTANPLEIKIEDE